MCERKRGRRLQRPPLSVVGAYLGHNRSGKSALFGDSRSSSVVILEHAPESFPTFDVAGSGTNILTRLNQLIAVGSKNSAELKVPHFTRFTACQIGEESTG